MRFIIIFFSVMLFAQVGNIKSLKGDVRILRNGMSLVAKVNSTINIKDVIITGENSKAKIVFKDNTIITIGKNSKFKVEEYVYNKKPKAKFSFLKGTFVSVTGKIGKIAPDRFKLRTKTAAIGIRGTIVFGSLNFAGGIIGCSSGSISVANSSGKVLLKASEAVGAYKGVLTKPFRIATGYIKDIAGKLSLNKNELKEFFGLILPSFHSSTDKNAKIKKVTHIKKDNKKTLTWADYKLTPLKKYEFYRSNGIVFDNDIFSEKIEYK